MASGDATPFPKKNVAFRVTFPIFDNDGDLVTGATALDSEVSLDGGTFADVTAEATEIATASGMYFLDLTAAEMNADTVAIIIQTTTTDAKTTPIVLYPEEAGDIRVNLTQISDDGVAAYNLELDYDGTGLTRANSTIGTVTTLTGHTAQTGDSFARLAAPAGASVSADIAAVKVDTAATLVDTADMQPKIGAPAADVSADIAAVKAETALIVADTNELQTDNVPGLIAALNDLSAAQVNTEVDTALIDAGLVLQVTTIATLASQTSFTLTAGSADNNAYNGCWAIITDISTATQKAIGFISAYTGSTKTVTLIIDPGIFTVVATDKIAIVTRKFVDLLAATQTSIDAIETDTADMQPKLGSPAADVSADIAAVKVDSAAIFVDTGTTLDTKINDIQGATFSSATDSLEAIRDRGDAAWITGGGGADQFLLQTTTIATLSSQTSFTLTAGSADNDAYNGCIAVITDVSTATQKAIGVISDYVGATKTVTLLNDPGIFTVAATDNISILADRSVKPVTDNRTLTVSASGEVSLLSATQTSIDAIETDTADIQPKIGSPAADLSADIAAVKVDTAAVLVDTADMQPKIGTPAADLSADIAAVKVDTAAVLVDTGTTLDTKINDIQGATFSSATDSLEAIRDRGDAAWTTGSGANPTTLQNTTIATLASQTSFTLTAGSADNDAYNGCLAVIEDSATATQKAVGVISDYVGSTKTLTLLNDPAVFTMAVGDTIDIIADRAVKPIVDNRTLAVSASGEISLLAATQTSIDAIETDTADMQPKIGTPAADISADIAAVKVDTAATLVDTAEIGAAGAGLTDLGGMSTGMKAEVKAEMVDVESVDTVSLPGKVTLPLTPTRDEMRAFLYKALRNRNSLDKTANLFRIFADDESTVDHQATISDDGTTFIRQELGVGA